MPVSARTQDLLTARKTSLEQGVDRCNSIASSAEWELFLIEQLLFGNSGGALGAPIPDVSLILSAPQFGDDAEGEVDGVWHPALGDPLLSEEPTDINGIPLEAQSVQFLVRLPSAILALDTDEAWELKNIAAWVRLDGGRPSFDTDAGIRGLPVGGAYAKAWVDRASALQAIAEARWRPSAGQTEPYPNYRPIAEVYFYREPIPGPVFEPSLIVTIGGGATTTTPTVTGAALGIGDGNVVLAIGDGNVILGAS